MGNILGMIYLNVKGREPQGCVEPGAEYDALRERLMAELRAEVSPHTGQPLFAKVEKGNEVFAGVYQPHGPDIVCTPHDWRYQVFGYQDFVSNRFVETYSEMTGHHRMDGILFGKGPLFKSGEWLDTCKLVDLAPTILHLLGLPVPSDMDGRVLEEMFSDDGWQYPETQFVEETAVAVADEELSAADQQQVMQRLKDLGYEDGL